MSADLHGATERTVDVDGVAVNLLESQGPGIPTVFVHGVPTSARLWLPFIARLEGPALAPDQPGFGRSGPPAHGAATLEGYSRNLERLLEVLEVDRYNLVVQDWGGLALHTAQQHPERINRLVVINAVPLLPGYEWHWVARLWRRRVIGEMLNRSATRFATSRLLRLARAGNAPMPDEFIDLIWDGWDRDTQDAILSLYRSADPDVLAAAGSGLAAIQAPAMVLWGREDPYIPTRFGRAYAARLPNANLVELARAGHWPWLDRPEVIDRVIGFLED